MKQFLYFAEAAALAFLSLLFKVMPPRMASNAGGWLGRRVGSSFAGKASGRAHHNLKTIMPDLNDNDIEAIITDMWDNLGRVIAEYPHLEKIAAQYVEIENEHYFDKDNPMILIAAHLGNWEIPAAFMLQRFNKKLNLTYRPPNNPWVHKLLMYFRTMGGQIKAYTKSRQGAHKVMKALRDETSVGILIDQKYNEGVNIPFMGHDAMTNPFFVQLAHKYGYPVIPAQIERLHDCHFRITLHPPVKILDENGQKRPLENVIGDVHSLMEQWIRARPAQWLWIHRRWRFTDK